MEQPPAVCGVIDSHIGLPISIVIPGDRGPLRSAPYSDGIKPIRRSFGIIEIPITRRRLIYRCIRLPISVIIGNHWNFPRSAQVEIPASPRRVLEEPVARRCLIDRQIGDPIPILIGRNRGVPSPSQPNVVILPSPGGPFSKLFSFIQDSQIVEPDPLARENTPRYRSRLPRPGPRGRSYLPWHPAPGPRGAVLRFPRTVKILAPAGFGAGAEMRGHPA
jgi:hypothetical protein